MEFPAFTLGSPGKHRLGYLSRKLKRLYQWLNEVTLFPLGDCLDPEVSEVFEQQYDEQMVAEIRRLEGKQRAVLAGHPQWHNACVCCGCELAVDADNCDCCGSK